MRKKVALVTGASRGIGAAIAKKLSRDGFNVYVGYCLSSLLAKKVVQEIQEDGGKADAVFIDITSRESINVAVNSIFQKSGTLDILINNAAISQEKPFLNICDEDWDLMMAANLRGPFACIQAVMPKMTTQGWGRIVNIVSIGGQWGGVNQIHYATAKAGLIGLTRSLAKTYGKYGVTINAVSPGLVETDMTRVELASSDGQKKVQSIPMGRVGTKEEIAGAVSFLLMNESSYITGQTININGGMYFG